MIKFLFYLFLIYIIYRLIFGRVMGGTIRTKVFHHNVHHHYHQQQTNGEPEGKITVDPKVKQKNNGTTGKIGEYIDYEEVN